MAEKPTPTQALFTKISVEHIMSSDPNALPRLYLEMNYLRPKIELHEEE